MGTVDISRLNYVVLTLISKVKSADLISQFRPIALMNNFAKIPAKGMATRVSPIAHRVISPFQSAFIKGRYIVESVVSAHEIIHDAMTHKTPGFIFKLDYKKAYDRVSKEFLLKIMYRR